MIDLFDRKLVDELHGRLRETNRELCVAESCTGGLLGGAITAVPGSSDVFQGGVIAYSDRAKQSLLGVSVESLKAHGAVSEPVAGEMVSGVCERFEVDVGLSITGIAGPSGGTAEKPVGLVYLGITVSGQTVVEERVFDGDRRTIRGETVNTALRLLTDRLQ